MGDSSRAEQTPSSHRNTSISTNAQSNFKTPTCFWVQRLSGTVQSASANGLATTNTCHLPHEAVFKTGRS
jgi:hypothetical protein